MMRSIASVASLLAVTFCLISYASAFAPVNQITTPATSRSTAPKVVLNIFSGDEERKALTRDTEPDDFFRTNTDKMSDEEKIPLALVGVAAICVPFIAGLIALYAAK